MFKLTYVQIVQCYGHSLITNLDSFVNSFSGGGCNTSQFHTGSITGKAYTLENSSEVVLTHSECSILRLLVLTLDLLLALQFFIPSIFVPLIQVRTSLTSGAFLSVS